MSVRSELRKKHYCDHIAMYYWHRFVTFLPDERQGGWANRDLYANRYSLYRFLSRKKD